MWLLLLVVLTLLLYRWYRQSQILENLSDKYVLITGCDSGFGNLAAKQLDRRGLKVLAACLTEKGAEELKKETSSRLQTVILDVTDSQRVKSVAKWVAEIVGDKGLWGLLNNAGTGMPGAPNEWWKKDDFTRVLNVNLLGPVDVTLNILPLIRKAQGRIVNVSSIVGRVTICGGGYCISKYGVEAFSDSLRRELKPFGVKVSIIEPGYFQTQLNDLQRMKNDLKNIWTNVSEEVHQSYGRQYFEDYVADMEKTFLSLSNTDLTPVTNCMVHALTAVNPYTRYSAGWDAKLFFIPISYVPTFLADYLMTRTAPRPANVAH
ncbi:retinol dehydrogenase 7 [Bombina bombina]|uniref:retinol dehydrogenase 7 n=1 Tax=Bombina bombina TaxID=8345 RepID=UPI00235AED00|nr:retinol dehydrogenase 7 [Bombina bombina]